MINFTTWNQAFETGPEAGPRPDRRVSLAQLLALRAAREGERCSHLFITREAEIAATLTYRELDLRARVLAQRLLDAGVAADDRVMIMVDPGLPSLVSIYACFYAGAVAVPVAPTLERVGLVMQDCTPKALLVGRAQIGAARLLAAVGDLQPALLNVDEIEDAGAAHSLHELPDCKPEKLAVLQYTSGSTGDPKGVMVTHGNLLHLLGLTEEVAGYGPSTRLVSWLPTFHDLGLIGGILQPVFSGFPAALLAPMAFLSQPNCWLQTMTNLRATSSAAPNFAYEMCARRITPEQRRSLDLSSVRTLICAGEPIMASTLQRFNDTFASCDLSPTALQPAYGLAEATLETAMAVHGKGFSVCAVDSAALRAGEFRPVPEAEAAHAVQASVLVSSGRPVQTTEIVEPGTQRRCGLNRIGEIWVQSPAVAAGYWKRSEASLATFGARIVDQAVGSYLRTGDMGVLHDGELFVTGRQKDVIIVRGENHWPQDIEDTAQRAHPSVRAGCVVAFSIPSDTGEKLVVVAETQAGAASSSEDILRAIGSAVRRSHRLKATVALVPARSVPKTTSGKLQRRACREAFLEGKLVCLAVLNVADADMAPTLTEAYTAQY